MLPPSNIKVNGIKINQLVVALPKNQQDKKYEID